MTRHSRVDTTLSAIITDADSFPPEATTPNKDDQRQGIYPLRVYQGYNYLPTAYGYKSYFGLQATLDANGLVSPDAKELVVEEMFVYQTRAFINVLVALTSHGIFIRTDGDWLHLHSMTAPEDANTSLPWTVATLTHVMFLYRQGAESVLVFDDIVDGTGVSMDTFNGMAVQPTRVDVATGQPIHVYEFVPTTLNMAGQIGIFRAGGSLGFWDSDDSIAWSAINDFTDFEPSLTTLANTTKLQDQIGGITTVLPHGDGFIVYCTRSVLYAREDSSALLRYSTRVVLGNTGVAYPREVAVAEPDTTHFAFTSAGLMQIEAGRAEPIIPDFSDYVKATRLPQYMKMLNNRYLCVGVMDPNFIPGNVEYSTGNVDPEDYLYEGGSVGGISIPGEVIEGGEVCFTIPNEDPDAEGIADSGIKPYHLLQMYNQWLYEGANFQTTDLEIGDETVTVFQISEGNTQARYDVAPVSMTAAEVDDFNNVTQVPELEQRQREQYAEAYKDTTLKLQERWDAYQAIRTQGLVGVAAYSLDSLGIVTIPGYAVDSVGNEANPHNLDAFYYPGDRGPTFQGYWMQDALGNAYIMEHYDLNGSGQDLQPLLINKLIDVAPEYKEWLGTTDPDTGDWYSGNYQWVGKMSELDWQQRYPDDWPEFREIIIDKANSYFARKSENLEMTSDGPYNLPKPFVADDLELLPVDGAKLAYRLSMSDANGYKITLKVSVERHKVLRNIASRVNVHIPVTNIFAGNQYTGKKVEDSAYFSGRIEGRNTSGTIVYQKTVKRYYQMQQREEFDAVISSPLSMNRADAQDLMFDQGKVVFDGWRASIRDPLSAEWSQIVADEEAQAESMPDVATIHWSSICSKPNDNYAEGEPTGINDGTVIGYDLNEQYQNVEYPCLYFDEFFIEEESEDLSEVLFGKTPSPLSNTRVGVSAQNALAPEVKRGLIAVYQHWYNRNNSLTELDASFLITAAGYVDVPLGAPLGSVLDVIDEANFANRYYIMDYQGADAVDETGASFVVPGQSEAQMLASQQTVVCGVSPDIILDPIVRDPIVYPPWEIEVPELTWVMQNGSRAPYNPTLFGAYVYDTHLGKWGVFKGDYKHLIDYQPINNYSPGSVSYKNFMVDGGCLTPGYEVALFNDYPSDSLLRYGKYQHVGSEVCSIEQVHVEFNEKSTGMVAVQFSLDGRRLEYGHSVAKWYNESLSTTLNCDIVGQWATISFAGHFDIAGLRVKSNPSGRR